MTEEQKRIKIAEACGWTAKVDDRGFWRAVTPSGLMLSELWVSESNVWSQGIPNYFHDLNAMHEAEKLFTNPHTDRRVRQSYRNWLHELNRGQVWSATAAQRAEAFGRVKGLWK